MTSTLELDVNRASLAHLSLAASQLWEEIDNCPEEADLEILLDRLLDIQNATEAKIDSIAWVVDQLNLDLKSWSQRLHDVTELYQNIISRRQKQLEKLKNYLLHWHQQGVLPEKVVGIERRINFQNNPPSVVLKVPPEELPPEFQEVKLSPKISHILAAHKAGTDVSSFADVVVGKHVRFYYNTRRQSPKKR